MQKGNHIDIDKYNTFMKIVKLGSVTKDAQELGYTQAAVSHIINTLEKNWNMTLLLRDRSDVRLTSQASKLLPLLKNICLANQELLNEIAEIHGLASSIIRIGILNSIAVHLLPKIIKKFNFEYPNIDFDIKIGIYKEVEELVESGQVDFGFTRIPTAQNLNNINLGTDRLLVILPEQHHLTKYEKIPIEKISNEIFLTLEEGPENETLNLFSKFNVWPKVKFVSKDDYAIISMVESELGISILPELVLQRTPFKIILRELEIPMNRHLGIISKDAKYARPATSRFLEYFHKNDTLIDTIMQDFV